jgi:hypothetical protein
MIRLLGPRAAPGKPVSAALARQGLNMTKPTEEAERLFYQAQGATSRGIVSIQNDPAALNILAALSNISQGLANLAVGVRATYILLEQVNRKLDQQR